MRYIPLQVLVVLLLLSSTCVAQMPAYYNGIDFSQDGDNLKIQLQNLITYTHTTDLPYTSSSLDTWDAVKQTDVDPNNAANVLLFYGFNDTDNDTQNDHTRDKDLSCHTSSCTGLWNREHVYAKSIATPSLITDDPGSGTDVHNLRACDGNMNSSRNNRLYQDDAGNAHITSSGNWYPGDEWKGDVARIIMYMYVRYPNQCEATAIGIGNTSFTTDMPDIFLVWNEEDPVSTYELQRNAILENIQGNRNPFIDNPYLATQIWGGPAAEDTWGTLANETITTQNSLSIYPTVTSSTIYISNNTQSTVKSAIYTMNGQSIAVTQNNNTTIDVSNLTKGVYILQLQTETALQNFKFIKQ